MAAFSVSTPVLTAIRYIGYLLAFVFFVFWAILIIFSSTGYEFTNETTNLTCYENFTTAMQQQTQRYRFDFWVIWLEVIVGSILVIIWILLMAEIREVAFYFIHAGLSILIIFFFAFKTGYYYIAFLSCQLYWFCISPCYEPYRQPTYAFWISFIFGAIALLSAVVQVLINPVIHGLMRAARKKEVLVKGESGVITSKIDEDGNQYSLLLGLHLVERGMYNWESNRTDAIIENGKQLEMDDDSDDRYN